MSIMHILQIINSDFIVEFAQKLISNIRHSMEFFVFLKDFVAICQTIMVNLK